MISWSPWVTILQYYVNDSVLNFNNLDNRDGYMVVDKKHIDIPGSTIVSWGTVTECGESHVVDVERSPPPAVAKSGT